MFVEHFFRHNINLTDFKVIYLACKYKEIDV